MTQLEREFQRQVTELARLHGWRVYSVPDSRRSTEKGYPDLTLWHPTHKRFMFAELKRDIGKLRPEQAVVIAELVGCGHTVFVWRPKDWPEIESVLGHKPVE